MTGAEAVRFNAAKTFVDLARGAPNVNIVESDAYCIVTSSFDHPIANFAVRLDLAETDFRTIADIASQRRSFRVHHMTGDSPPDVLKRFEALGLYAPIWMAGMQLVKTPTEKHPLFGSPVPKQRLNAVIAFIIENFFWSSPPETRMKLISIAEAAAHTNQEFFAEFDEQGPIAAATLVATGPVAGIYNICVRQTHRGRGLGSALVRRVAVEAARRGQVVVLQAEPDLVPWYANLGFQRVGDIVVMAWKP